MKTADDLLFKVKDSIKNFNPIKEFLLATGCGFACRGGISDNGCEHEQCGFGANQLSLTTNLVGTTHFHNQKTSIAYACC